MTVHVPSRSTGPSKTTEQQGRAANSTDNESLEVPASLGAKLSGGAIGSARALREVLTLNDVAIPPGASDAEVARLAETQRWPQQHQGTVQRVTARMLEPATGPAPKAASSRAAVAQRAHLASGQLLAHNLHRRFEEGPRATGVGTGTGGTSDGAVDAGGTSTGAGGTRTTATRPGAAAPPLSAQAAPMSMAAAPGETQDPEEPSVNASDPEGARNNLELARTLWRENPSDPANIDRLEKAIADASLAGKPVERDTHADNMVELARQMRQDAADAKEKAERGELPQEEADRLADAAEEATVQAYEAKMGIEHDSPPDPSTPDTKTDPGGDLGGDAPGREPGGELGGERGGELGGERGGELGGELGVDFGGDLGGDFDLGGDLGGLGRDFGGGFGGGGSGGGGRVSFMQE